MQLGDSQQKGFDHISRIPADCIGVFYTNSYRDSIITTTVPKLGLLEELPVDVLHSLLRNYVICSRLLRCRINQIAAGERFGFYSADKSLFDEFLQVVENATVAERYVSLITEIAVNRPRRKCQVVFDHEIKQKLAPILLRHARRIRCIRHTYFGCIRIGIIMPFFSQFWHSCYNSSKYYNPGGNLRLICDAPAGPRAGRLEKAYQPGRYPRPVGGSHPEQPMNTNSLSGDKSPATTGFVEAYQDSQTGQLIFSGSGGPGEEIRARNTIDLEASR